MAPIRRRKKEAADQTPTCLDALRLLDISRDAPSPTLKGTGPAGNAEAAMPPPPQEVEVDAEPETSKLPTPPQPPREVEAEAEPETPKHPSPPPPQEEEEEAESEMSRHMKAVLKAMLDMGALPDHDERYGSSYLGDFFAAYIQAPRPIDPPWLPEPDAAGLGPIVKARYPYLAGEVARIADADTTEQREALGGALLREVDAGELSALDGEFHEATWAGKRAMLAKLEAEVQYARARIDAEALIEMLGGAAKASSSV